MMTISLWSRIKEFRELNWLSQEQLAEMLGVGRATLTQIEWDKRTLRPDELKTLSQIFDTSVDFLLSGKSDLEQNINPSPEQKELFKKLILYVLDKVWAKYNVGKVVLYKLLYFSEFDYYELYHQHISWYPFIKLPMWPAPRSFDTVIGEMKHDNQIISVTASYPNSAYYQQRYIPNIPVDESRFSPQIKKSIQEVIDRYSDYNATQISEESHKDKPRQITQDMNLINYDLVKFREYPYSPTQRHSKKQQVQTIALTSSFFADLYHEPDLYEDCR